MFTLEKWQEILIKKLYEVNFISDKEIINNSFKELCQPLNGLKKEHRKFECGYRGIQRDQYDLITLVFEVGNYAYQLNICEKSLILFAVDKTGGYQNHIPVLNKVCSVKYEIDKGKQKYKVGIDNRDRYKTIAKCNSIESEKTIEEEYDNFVFNKDTYKTIINNLMDIVETGTLEGKNIFEDYIMNEPFM